MNIHAYRQIANKENQLLDCFHLLAQKWKPLTTGHSTHTYKMIKLFSDTTLSRKLKGHRSLPPSFQRTDTVKHDSSFQFSSDALLISDGLGATQGISTATDWDHFSLESAVHTILNFLYKSRRHSSILPIVLIFSSLWVNTEQTTTGGGGARAGDVAH